MTAYKNLEAWKKAMKLITEIYLITKEFPKEELYALTSQIKRAAVSIAANIAEGAGRNYKKDTIQFLHIARGSVYELETLIHGASNVQLISDAVFKMIESMFDEEIRILNGLIKSYETRTDLK